MPELGVHDTNRHDRFYFAGIAAAIAACLTHPLDTLKVLLQTQTADPPLSLFQLIIFVCKTEGILGFYAGLTAGVVRQLTYTMGRLGIYDHFKFYIEDDDHFSLLLITIAAGIVAALMGMPADVVNVRMQNNMRLPPEERRDYKNVFHGMYRICMDEGICALYKGTLPNVIRGTVITLSSNAIYDKLKRLFLTWGLPDNSWIHFLDSAICSMTGTTATNPIDVVKTRMMNAGPDDPSGICEVTIAIAKEGPLAFYKGYIPALCRSAPQTVLFFLIKEQMRLYFGFMAEDEENKQSRQDELIFGFE